MYKLVFVFNPIQDGHFWGCLQIGGGGGRAEAPNSIKSVTHILHDEIWYSYTLPTEDPKNI